MESRTCQRCEADFRTIITRMLSHRPAAFICIARVTCKTCALRIKGLTYKKNGPELRMRSARIHGTRKRTGAGRLRICFCTQDLLLSALNDRSTTWGESQLTVLAKDPFLSALEDRHYSGDEPEQLRQSSSSAFTEICLLRQKPHRDCLQTSFLCCSHSVHCCTWWQNRYLLYLYSMKETLTHAGGKRRIVR